MLILRGRRRETETAYFRFRTAQFSELRGTGLALLGSWLLMRTNMCIKCFIYRQLRPIKSMKQFIDDRCLYRVLIFALLILNWCF